VHIVDEEAYTRRGRNWSPVLVAETAHSCPLRLLADDQREAILVVAPAVRQLHGTYGRFSFVVLWHLLWRHWWRHVTDWVVAAIVLWLLLLQHMLLRKVLLLHVRARLIAIGAVHAMHAGQHPRAGHVLPSHMLYGR